MSRINQVEDLLDEFDFAKVKKVMDCLEWTYYNSEDTTVSIEELRRMARYLLESAYNSEDKDHYLTSSGGFYVDRYMYPGDMKKYLELKFIVTSGSNPCF